jgi:osmotically-inducible protein OsmY
MREPIEDAHVGWSRVTVHEDDAAARQDQQRIALVRSKIADSALHNWSHEIQLQCQDGVFTLSGRLPSYYFKQVLQTLVRDVPGVIRVDNHVHVLD